MKTRRILSLLLTISMVMSFMPVFSGTTHAEGEIGIQTSVPDFVLGTDSDTPTVVNFAGYQWLAIGYEEAGVASSEYTLTLLAKDNVWGNTVFNSSGIQYENGALHNKMNSIHADIVNVKEQNLVKTRTIDAKNNSTGTENIDNQYFWPLSKAEANALYSNTVRSFGNSWWLRSPGDYVILAAFVDFSGGVNVDGILVNLGSNAARPAFNLDLSSVLFTSAAAGGKSSATVGSGLIPAEPVDTNLKFTIKDSSLTLGSVTRTSRSGNTIYFNYSGATEGKTLSAVVLDNAGEVKYYGKLENNISASGSSSVTLPNGLAATDTVQIFVEEANDGGYTDFASAYKSLDIRESITGAAVSVTAPKTDNAPDTVAETDDENYTLGAVAWSPNPAMFAGNTQYTASVTLTAKSGYTFAGLTTAEINGETAAVSDNTGNTVKLSYAFPATTVPLFAVGSKVYYGVYPQTDLGTTQPAGEEGVDWISAPYGESSSISGSHTGETHYYKLEPIEWRVLRKTDGSLFLLSEKNIDVKLYNETYTGITWETSTIRSWLNGYTSNQAGASVLNPHSYSFIDRAFSGAENKAVKETNVQNPNNPTHNTPGGNATNDKIFLLSIAEATNPLYGFSADSNRKAVNTGYTAHYSSMHTAGADYWWLRSPGDAGGFAAYVKNTGVVSDGGNVNYGFTTARPAFNLILPSVLFTSAAAGNAAGGKSSATVGSGLIPVNPVGTDLKFTIFNDSLELGKVTHTSKSGSTIYFNYSGATEGKTLSAVILDDAGEVKYYGKLKNGISASGSSSVTLPGDFASTDTVQIFVEQANGDKYTDYASAYCQLDIRETIAASVVISGDLIYGSQLTAVPYITSAYPGTLTYQWKRGGSKITGATGDKYTLTADDIGEEITVEVKAPNYAGKLISPVSQNVEKKTLTWKADGTVKDKTYDRNKAAEANTQPTLDGIINGDTVTVSNGTVEFDNAGAGNNKTVTASGYGITGANAGYYNAPASQPTFANGKINPKSVSFTGTITAAKVYDGTSVFTNDTITITNPDSFSAGDIIGADEVALSKTDVTGAFGPNVGTGTLSLSGAFTLTGAQAGNYTLSAQPGVSASITQANGGTVSAPVLAADGRAADSLTITNLTPPASGQTVEYAVNITNTAPPSGWQTGLTFSGLSEYTQYYIFARAKENSNYKAGSASASLAAFTLDVTAPTATIEIKGNAWTGFLNTITFGMFFKNTVDVDITALDESCAAGNSGVDTVEYYMSEDTLTENAAQNITDWEPDDNFSINANWKGVVYARITDNDNNVTVISSDGVVVFSESAADTTSVSFTKGSQEDITASVTLNGNTIASVKNGANALTTSPEQYAVSDNGKGNEITLKESYLNTLAKGTYTITVLYNPMGEAYKEKYGSGPADPENDQQPSTTFTLLIKETQSINLDGWKSDYTYGDPAFDVSIQGQSGTGAVTYSLVNNADGAASIDGKKITVLKAGTFKIKVAIAADELHEAAEYTTTEITVSEDTPIVTLSGNDVDYGQHITLTAAVSGRGKTPGGTVTFKEGNTVLAANVALNAGGEATYTTTGAFPTAGNHAYSVVYSGEADYYTSESGEKSIDVDMVNQAELIITGKPNTVTYGDAGFNLTTGTSGSGNGAVVFSVPGENVISISSSGTVTINNQGSVTVTAVKAGDGNYTEARATIDITVEKRDITLVSVTVTGSKVYTGSKLQPNFEVSDGDIDITGGDYTADYGDNITVAEGGAITLTGQGNYKGTKAVTFDILKAIPDTVTFPTPAAVDYDPDKTLADITLSGSGDGTFEWEDDSIVPVHGNSGYMVKFIPRDDDNYDYTGVTLSATVPLTINKIDPAYTLPAGLTAIYGDALESVVLPNGWTWENIGTSENKALVGNAGERKHKAAFTPPDTNNYNTLTEIEVTVTVNKKAVTVTADNKEKYFGEEDPALTYTVNPALVSGDILTGSLKYTGTAVGTYTIAEDTPFSNPNYEITFTGGTMTIKKTPAMEVIEGIEDLPDPKDVDGDDKDYADDVSDITNDYEKLPDEEKSQIPDEVKKALEDAQEKAGEINGQDGDVIINGDLPWYVRVVATIIPKSDSRYDEFFDKLTEKKLIKLYDIKLVNTLTGEEYALPKGETVTVEISGADLADGEKIMVAHEKKDGTIQYLTATVKDGKLTFTASSFSLYGVTATADKEQEPTDESPDTGDRTNIPALLAVMGVSLGALVIAAKKRRNKKTT